MMEPFWELPWGQQPRFGERPWACDPSEAQPFLNVPLLWPERAALPQGMDIGALTVRPEGEAHWSSARLMLVGGGRRARLKQYFFDWWRPTELSAALQRTHGFYRAGDAVVAWGRDFRGRSAACLGWGRTMVELRIERGTFGEFEVRHLLATLAPAVPEALPMLAAPAFPLLSFHARRQRGPRQLDELAGARWSLAPDSQPLYSPLLLPQPMPPGWRFDAAAHWPAPPPHETQWLLRDERGACVFYARARPSDDNQPLKLPALYRPQEGWRARQTMLRRRRVTLAAQHPDLGGWSAAWAEEGHRYQLFVRAGALAGEHAFRNLLQSLQPA